MSSATRRVRHYTCKVCGRVFETTATKKAHRCPECRRAEVKRQNHIRYELRKAHLPSATLNPEPLPPAICWTCQNAVPEDGRGCSWSREDHEPIPGWTVIPSRHTPGGMRVMECPEYVEDEPEPETQPEQ